MSKINEISCNSCLSVKSISDRDGIPKIAAVVILYNPDETFVSNLNSYCSFVDKVYIYDNSETSLKYIKILSCPKIEYYYDSQNNGLAERLNQAAKRAIKDGFDWLLTMDQDSFFSYQAISKYYDSFLAFDNKKKIALFGPVHCKNEPGWQSGDQFEAVDKLITSGTLLNLSLFNEIGGFDESLFIDTVDYDYCIRARLAGYRIIQFSKIAIIHELGFMVHRASIKTLFLIKKHKELHAPLRCYYMLRNILYLKAKYQNFKLPVLKIIEDDIKDRLARYLFYGRNSSTLVKYLFLAYKHYKQNRMGKFVMIK